MLRILPISFAILILAGAMLAQGVSVGSKVGDFTLPGLDGKQSSLSELKGSKGTLVVFVSAQCPVVKGYNGRISEIESEYSKKGINFVAVNSNATEDLAWIKSNAAENYKFPVLIDKGNVLADKLNAQKTPEVFFIAPDGTLLYHGAIDNDRSGANVTEPYLKTAFDAALAGKPIARNNTVSFGCTIKRAAIAKPAQ